MPFSYTLATGDDDAELRRLLRDNPLPGLVKFSFEREPSFFDAAALEGDAHQTVVVRQPETGAIIGMGSLSLRSLYVNGAVMDVGYMSQLRLDAPYRSGLLLAKVLTKCFALWRSLDFEGRAPFYFGSIIANNAPVMRLFEAGLPGLPRFRPYGELYTYAILRGRRKRPLSLPAGLTLVRGSAEHTDAIVACLQRNGARRQLAPVWTAANLFSAARTPGLHPQDFFLALAGQRVVGCLACWDQQRLKQTVVRAYAPLLARTRRLINGAARLGGWFTLPPPGSALGYAYASHLAVDADDPAIFAALLRALYNYAVERAYAYVMLGLSAANPLRATVTKAYRHLAYVSRLYLAAWPEQAAVLSTLDARVPAPEIALL